MNGDFDDLTTGARYYEQRYDRIVVPRVALDSEVYFTEEETGARFRYDRGDVEELLGDGGLVALEETAEVLGGDAA